jgi:large subunit ribosomal protein L24
MTKCKIRKGDLVEVTVGKDAARSENHRARGRVLAVDHKRGKVTVEGINQVYKHVRPSRRHPQGGRLHIEKPIDISNVRPVDPKTDRGVRVGFQVNEDGSKERVSKATGSSMGQVRTARNKG